MKAFAKVGDPLSAIELVTMPTPSVGPGEILVAVKAVGVGVHDAYFLPQGISYPYTIGIEGAGEVVDTGPGASEYSPGDRVAFISAMQPKGGTWGEYAIVSPDSLVLPVPPQMSWVEAAAIPIAASTALRALAALSLDEGETLFISGASGAVGTAATQIASRDGLRIAGSASPANHEHVIAMGATKAVDYRSADWVDEVRRWAPGGVDAAIAVLRETTVPTMEAVRDGGRIVTVSGDQAMSERSITVLPLAYQLDVRTSVARIFEDTAAGRFRIVLDRVVSFDDALDALRQTQTHRARGKLVIDLDS